MWYTSDMVMPPKIQKSFDFANKILHYEVTESLTPRGKTQKRAKVVYEYMGKVQSSIISLEGRKGGRVVWK